MTPQEQEMIGGLIDRVAKTQLPEKDPEAEAMLQQGLGRNPDSLYILAQTVLVQKYALDQAQKQLADLKAQLSSAQSQQQQPKHATSFLGSIFGSHEDDKHAPPPPLASNQPSPTPPYTPVQNYPQAAYPPQGYPQAGGYAPAGGYTQGQGFGAPPPSGGGFLRSAMQTATGVAAGALAFQGIESLMHGFGGGGSSFGGGRPEEVINNYYGDNSRDNRDDRSGLSSDVEDRRDSGSFFDPNRDASSNNDESTDTDAFAGARTDDDNTGLGDDSGDSNFNDVDDFSYSDDGGDSGGGDDSSFS